MTDEWMTETEAAEWLRVRPSDVMAAVLSGELPGLRFGGNLRISRSRLLGLVEENTTNLPAPGTAPGIQEGVPMPEGFIWLEDLKPAAGFSHPWPQRGGGTTEETYARAWKGCVDLNGSQAEVLVGETTRDHRGRLTIFFDGYPVAEFMDTEDGTGWVSVIKPDGKKTIGSAAGLPPLYRGLEVAPYRAATGTSGSGRPTGLAIVIRRDDRESAVHHAAARQIGKTGRVIAGPPSYYWIEVEMVVPRQADVARQNALAESLTNAYNSKMLRRSEISWADDRTAVIRMAAGAVNRKDAERAVGEMVKRHAAVTEIAAEQAVRVRVLNSTIFDPIAFRAVNQRGAIFSSK